MVFKKVVGLFMVAVMMAAGFVSFAHHESKKVPIDGLQTADWLFQPQPGSTDPTNPLNYQLGNTSGCGGSQDICGISAPVDQDYFDEHGVAIPEIDDDLTDQILERNGPDVSLMN